MSGPLFLHDDHLVAMTTRLLTLRNQHAAGILDIFTARKRSLGQGNKFTGVCLSTGGKYLTRYTPSPSPGTRYTPRTRYTHQSRLPPGTRYTPQSRHPLGPGTPPRTRYTPPKQTTPAQSMLGDTVYARAVRILLECNLGSPKRSLSIKMLKPYCALFHYKRTKENSPLTRTNL